MAWSREHQTFLHTSNKCTYQSITVGEWINLKCANRNKSRLLFLPAEMFKKPPIGAVCSWSKLFVSIINSSVMLGKYFQQTTSADVIFQMHFFLGAVRVKWSDYMPNCNILASQCSWARALGFTWPETPKKGFVYSRCILYKNIYLYMWALLCKSMCHYYHNYVWANHWAYTSNYNETRLLSQPVQPQSWLYTQMKKSHFHFPKQVLNNLALKQF